MTAGRKDSETSIGLLFQRNKDTNHPTCGKVSSIGWTGSLHGLRGGASICKKWFKLFPLIPGGTSGTVGRVGGLVHHHVAGRMNTNLKTPVKPSFFSFCVNSSVSCHSRVKAYKLFRQKLFQSHFPLKILSKGTSHPVELRQLVMDTAHGY